ncbi:MULTISPECIES: MFS transporter [Alkalihalophilus]|uniref:MFS transporter n=1 Tax=Alkalihalophilus TaxID=2893060 RepID=UPI00259B677E|nr:MULTISPECIES: MFS transporter [Alkalihalophilus]MEC2072005.1 MFS transporter [Alkalihalophilus marmarensis]WEG17571.1 MFS transporter [Alkalihalophilus pseudofirmus]
MAELSVEREESAVVRERSLMKEYRFLLLFFTLLVSSLSVSFFMVATNWYVVDYLGVEVMLGIVFFASSVPRLIFMLIGGVIADRMSKAWVMFLSDFLKGLLLLGVIALFLFDLFTIWPLVILAFIFGVLDAFFWPASGSILPECVKQSQLTRANTIIDMTRQGSMIAGPLLAASMLALGGYVLLFGITALLLLLAGVIDLVLKKKIPEKKVNDAGSNQTETVIQAMKEGFRYVKQSPFLLALMASTIFLNFFFSGPLQLGMPIFASHVLQGDEVTYALLNGGIAAGMLAGGIIIGIVNVQRKRGLVSIIAMSFIGLMFLGLSLSTTFIGSMLFIILLGAAVSITNIPLITVIQSHTNGEYLGRVMSLTSFASMGLMPISYLSTSMLLAAGLPIEQIMFYSAAGLVFVCLMILWKAEALRTAD